MQELFKMLGKFLKELCSRCNGIGMEFDARPSDCIAIALRDDAPIMIDAELFNDNSMSKDKFHSSRDGIILDEIN